MKTAIIITENTKQVVFTPEDEVERKALAMFSHDHTIELSVQTGAIGMNQLGYLRMFDEPKSVILVLKPRKNDPPAGN